MTSLGEHDTDFVRQTRREKPKCCGRFYFGFLTIALFVCSAPSLSSATPAPAYEAVQQTLDQAIKADSPRWLIGSYHGNLKISEAKMGKDGERLSVKGSFQTNGPARVATRYFDATIKVVLDAFVVEKCCWQTFANTLWCVK